MYRLLIGEKGLASIRAFSGNAVADAASPAALTFCGLLFIINQMLTRWLFAECALFNAAVQIVPACTHLRVMHTRVTSKTKAVPVDGSPDRFLNCTLIGPPIGTRSHDTCIAT